MSFFPQSGQGFFSQGSFQVDPNSTPEMLARKREMIASMMPRFGQARYVGQGIGQLATGIAAGRKNRALDKFEGERRSEASGLFNKVFSGGGGQSSGPLSILGAREPQGQPAPSSNADFDVRAGLIDRGMPEHIADAFVMNMQDESGLNPGINETTPLVPGSRGGFGLSQWTGPRRRALEAFAEQRGVPVSDGNMQLDFLMSELQGPESAAAKEIFAAQDTGTAAAAIVNKFLRPAEEHRARRVAKYTNGQGVAAPGPQAAQTPEMNNLLMMAQNPWLSQQQRQVVNGQIQQMQGQQRAVRAQKLRQDDPLYQAQLAQAQLNLEQDRNGGGIDPAKVQSSVPLDDGTTVMIMTDGTRRVLGPAGQVLEGQEAAAAIKAAREYTVENQQEIYGARRNGTLGADIALGGIAAATQDVAKATVKAGVSAWEDYGKMQSSIGTIQEAVAAIDGGAQSGIVYKMLPNITEASASLQNAMDRMGLDVVGSVTFGALSEGELRLAMQTAVPRDLAPPELRSWLVKKQAAQEKAAAMLADAAQFMTTPGNTINGWIEGNRAAKSSATPVQNAQPDTSAPSEALPNFNDMDLGAVLEVDVMTLDADGMDAWEKRLQELQNDR